MPFIKLDSYYTNHIPGGVGVGALSLTLSLGNGTTVETTLPFLPLGGNLGISPMVESDGESSITFDFSRWLPVSYGSVTGRFPFWFNSQADAAKVAHAFEADPAANWDDTRDQVAAWLRTWGATLHD